VYSPIVAFDPTTITDTYSFWTIITCNLVCDSIIPLAANLMLIYYIVNQIEVIWRPLTLALLYAISSILQVVCYWLIWIIADLVIPRSWTLGNQN
jgi:membrane associated rhomboid family serine protease